MNHQVPQMKPQFCLYKDINGSRSLQEFSMKKYKHLSKLKISKRPIKTPQNQTLLISTKLSASIKNLKHLDLSQCNLTNYCLSQLQLIAQKFHRIIRLSHTQEEGWKNGDLLSKIMLRNAKDLRHLCLGAISHFPQRAIRLSKLKILYLFPLYDPKIDHTSLLNFSKYCPLTIEELSLFRKSLLKAGVNYAVSLTCFQNLQKLSLGMVIPANLFKKMAESIANPSKLKSLQFYLAKCSEDDCEPAIRAFLNKCCSLEELDMKAEMDIYPANNSSIKLKKLTLEVTVEYAEEVLSLRNFIQGQKDSLESLRLTLRIWGADPENGILKGLKSLKGLKKLRLELYSNIPGINLQSSLTELVETFEGLEEFDFMDFPAVFNESDFENFCKALGKRDLRSLKLSLNNFKMTQKNSSVFLQTLMLFSRLECILLRDFEIEHPNFYEGLRGIVCNSKNLNEVILENVKREKTKTHCENVIRMLKGIIQKSTMKKLFYLEAFACDFSSDFKGLEVLDLHNDVLKEVHHFNHLQIPSYVCEPTFYHWSLDSYKWNVDLDELYD